MEGGGVRSRTEWRRKQEDSLLWRPPPPPTHKIINIKNLTLLTYVNGLLFSHLTKNNKN